MAMRKARSRASNAGEFLFTGHYYKGGAGQGPTNARLRGPLPHAWKPQRRRSESNRRWRLCRPLPYHLATAPNGRGSKVSRNPCSLRPSGKPDSNRRPPPWQGGALPTELFPQKNKETGLPAGPRKLEMPLGSVNLNHPDSGASSGQSMRPARAHGLRHTRTPSVRDGAHTVPGAIDRPPTVSRSVRGRCLDAGRPAGCSRRRRRFRSGRARLASPETPTTANHRSRARGGVRR